MADSHSCGRNWACPRFFNAEGKSSGHLDRGRSLPHHPKLKNPKQRRLHRRAGWFLARFREKNSSNQPSSGGTWQNSGSELLRNLTNYRLNTVEVGNWVNPITVERFEAGQKVDVSGDTIGRGFSGYQKRHGSAAGPMTTVPETTPARADPVPAPRRAGLSGQAVWRPLYGGKPNHHEGLTILKV